MVCREERKEGREAEGWIEREERGERLFWLLRASSAGCKQSALPASVRGGFTHGLGPGPGPGSGGL